MNYTFGFMYLIIQFYLICPLISNFIIEAEEKIVRYILIFWMLSVFMNNIVSYFKISLDLFNGYNAYIGYFILGYYMNKFNFDKKIDLFIFGLGILGMLITIFENYFLIKSNCGIFDGRKYSNLSLNVLFTSIMVFRLFKKKINGSLKNTKGVKIIKNLSSLVFGIYLIHDLILRILSSGKLGIYLCFFGSFNPIFNILLILSITFILSAGITYLFKNSILQGVV